MTIILILLAYCAYIAFWTRLAWHIVLWLRAPQETGPVPKTDGALLAKMSFDVLFFRRLFSSSKSLWAGSWFFHIAFLLVIIRHLRFFLDPVPGWVKVLQPVGTLAGYVLPFTLLFLFLKRVMQGKGAFLSKSNLFVIGLIFLISVIGLMLHFLFPVDVVAVKAFVLGVLSFRPAAPPDSAFFTVHFLLVLLLVPYAPFHFFTVPLVTLEARRREEGLKLVMHEK